MKTLNVKIVNTGAAARGFFAVAQATAVVVPPKTSRELLMTEANVAQAERLAKLGGGFDVTRLGEVTAEDAAKAVSTAQAVAPIEPAAPTPPAAASEQTADRFDAMDDAALRSFITDATGRAPHPNTGRPKLLDNARAAESERLANEPQPPAPADAATPSEAI